MIGWKDNLNIKMIFVIFSRKMIYTLVWLSNICKKGRNIMLCIMFRIVFLPISTPCSHIIKKKYCTNKLQRPNMQNKSYSCQRKCRYNRFIDLLFNTLCIMLKNCRTYLKNLAAWTPQDFKNMFDHFSTLRLEKLRGSEVFLFNAH